MYSSRRGKFFLIQTFQQLLVSGLCSKISLKKSSSYRTTAEDKGVDVSLSFAFFQTKTHCVSNLCYFVSLICLLSRFTKVKKKHASLSKLLAVILTLTLFYTVHYFISMHSIGFIHLLFFFKYCSCSKYIKCQLLLLYLLFRIL